MSRKQQPSESTDEVAAAKAQMRTFLQTASLYSPLIIRYSTPMSKGEALQATRPDTLALPCPRCVEEESTTWKKFEEPYSPLSSYRCVACGESTTRYWISVTFTKKGQLPTRLAQQFSRDPLPQQPEDGVLELKVEKAGQWPAWTVPVSKRLRDSMGQETLTLYKRGLACLREGLGIGASAYFRRVVEDSIDPLLKLVERVATLTQDQDLLAKLEEARREDSAGKRLKLASESVPQWLRPKGQNPLRILYSNLSGPLHTESEEEAVKVASMLQATLAFLYAHIESMLRDTEAYAEQLTAAGDRIGELTGARRAKNNPDS